MNVTEVSPGSGVSIVGGRYTRLCVNCGKEAYRVSRAEAMRKSWRFCCLSCRTSYRNRGNKYNLGKHLSEETKKKIGDSNRKPNLKNRLICGERHWNWQGGKTGTSRKIRNCAEYKYWRKAVFERDEYTCQDCGAKSGKGKGVVLNADHIKPFAFFPELRFDVANGKTLCLECHKKTPTFALKKRPAN